jgi:GH15 family glucan-1,4-alpha-glucosidase
MVVLHTDVPLHGEGMKTMGEFEVAAGDERFFVLTYGPSHLPPPRPIDPRKGLEHVQAFWRDWIAHCTVEGRWAGLIRRSLITLKALTYAPSGGVVAAATTSLPEAIGGVRNWDYRFCWIRDATLTLQALMTAGYYEEAQAWRDWLLRAVAGRPADMQIMYGITGERRLMEWEPTWLAGYENSKPVRIGNAAHAQLQLDVYGELADALHQARRGGLPGGEQDWHVQRALMDHLEQVWDRPDDGIWEVRGGSQHFTFSKVMAWVAADRALKDFQTYGHDGDFERWRVLCDAIRTDVLAHGFNAKKNSFTQVFGGEALDASLLLLAEVGFIEADDPRFVGTVAAIERELMHDGLVMRYDTGRTDDGLPVGEGVFLACSFWLVNAYVLLGRRDDAVALFERLAGLANDLGLLAEEYDTARARQVGNFPQAFSHIGLINAAFNLTRSARPAEERAKA